MPTRHKRGKGPRGNESPQAMYPQTSVPQTHQPAPVSSPLWDGITGEDIRDIVARYGQQMQLRFPSSVVIRLLDEIDRLEAQLNGQAQPNNISKSGSCN